MRYVFVLVALHATIGFASADDVRVTVRVTESKPRVTLMDRFRGFMNPPAKLAPAPQGLPVTYPLADPRPDLVAAPVSAINKPARVSVIVEK